MHMPNLHSFVLLTVTVVSSAKSALSFTWGFPYESQVIRGVNLGGWLLTESWITPSLYSATGNEQIVDEWTFCQLQDRAVAEAALKAHWDTFITEQDFIDIAAAGLNHVRVPIGSWAWDIAEGEPWIGGQRSYLNKAIEWAGKHNLKVMIDLHGVPGSQNGWDHSGQKMPMPTWHNDTRNIERTNEVIRMIIDEFKDMSGVVSAIAPMNEPAAFRSNDLLLAVKKFWQDSYRSIRNPYKDEPTRTSNTLVVIHDAFQSPASWYGFMSGAGWEGTMLDTHVYQIFDFHTVGWSEEQHLRGVCQRAEELKRSEHWTVVGEWSLARTDCAKWLNGRGVGTRYEGTIEGSTRFGSCEGFSGLGSTFSDEYKVFLRRFWEAQTSSYEQLKGWIHWTWKTEEAHEWSYQAGLEHGWIPRNPTERMYPDICSTTPEVPVPAA